MFGTNADSNQPGRNATQSRENDLFDFATLKKAVQADPVARRVGTEHPLGIFAAAMVRLIAAPGRESPANPSLGPKFSASLDTTVNFSLIRRLT
jgi:hypothetical protein